MTNFLPVLSVGGFEVYFGIFELSTNLHHLTSPHFHICTNDDGNDIQISEEKKKFVDENIWAKTNNNSQVDGDEIMKEEDNSDISEMMMMMVGTMSGGGWLRLSPVGKHLELTHWGGIIRICPAPYIIMDCRPTKKYCKKCCLFPRNCLSELRLNIILSFMSRFCHLYHFCNFCIMLRWVTQSLSQ